MGDGNNTLTINKAVNIFGANIYGSKQFAFGSGNDTFNIGINLDGKNTIYMGEGNNTLNVGASQVYKHDGYVGASSQSNIYFGAGNNTMTVRTNIDGNNTIVLVQATTP